MHNASTTELPLLLLERSYKYRLATLILTAVVAGSLSVSPRTDALKILREVHG